MEHARVSLGLKNVLEEIKGVYPLNLATLPVYRWHDWYGRHWDVLEELLTQLGGKDRPLAIVEIGVACGPIGKFLLQRFPQLVYTGVDPTIRTDVRAQYEDFSNRSTLYANTSEEVFNLFPDRSLDLVFVDGPHTYANVRGDIEMWQPKVRQGGILSGHDFTAAHPPLLWAVTEQRLMGEINVAMDGVWWWFI